MFSQLGIWFANAVACVLFAYLLSRRRENRNGQLPLPPGPKRLPVFGNLFQMPMVKLWEKAREWGEVYGANQHAW